MRIIPSLFMLSAILGAFPVAAQPGSIAGRVIDDANNKPIAGVEVAVPDLKTSTRTDTLGRFLITGIPVGKHAIVVRSPGFSAFGADLEFAPGARLDADFPLVRTSTKLEKVKVVAEFEKPFAIKLAEFDERRAGGIGKFITGDVFDKADGRPPSSIIQSYIAGINVIQSEGRRVLAGTRGGKSIPGSDPFQHRPRGCLLQIVLNGRPTYTGHPTDQVFDFDAINTTDIIGFEYYTVATTPLKYGGTGNGASTCGTAVIWTKGG